MDTAGILAIVELLMKSVPGIVQTGVSLAPFVESLWRQFNGKELTPAERAELRGGVDALYAKLQAPLPPPEPGDPDYVKT